MNYYEALAQLKQNMEVKPASMEEVKTDAQSLEWLSWTTNIFDQNDEYEDECKDRYG